MPIKENALAAKSQLADLLMKLAVDNNQIDKLVEKLDEKKFNQLITRIIKDIENEHWASTGANQTINAIIEVKIVGKDEEAA